MNAPSIDRPAFSDLWESRRSRPVTLLDVRERWEFADGHIPGAAPLPRGRLETCASLVLPARDGPVVVYSNDETRATLAVATLRAMGCPKACLLREGLDGWRTAGQPVATGWGAAGKKIGEDIAHEIPDLQAPAGTVAGWLTAGRTLVIDIRPRWEYEQGHVPGAAHVPAGALPAVAPAIRAAVESGAVERVVTHCAGRTRGIAAAQLLRALHVPKAYALQNGCMGWLLDGHALEYGTGAPVNEILTGDAGGGAENLGDALWMSADEVAGLRDGSHARYVVDLRTPDAYLVGHVPGAISLPAGQVLLESEAWLPCMALPVVLVGSSRAQTTWAASHLQALGYGDVRALDGGIAAWCDAGQALSHGLPPLNLPPRAFTAPLEEIPAEAYLADPGHWKPIDVRSLGEWGIAHLADSRCIPRGLLERQAASLRNAPQPLLFVSSTGLRAGLAAATFASIAGDAAGIAVLQGGLRSVQAAGGRLIDDQPDSAMASRDSPGRIPAAVWKMPLEKTRPLMLRYLAWEEALASRVR